MQATTKAPIRLLAAMAVLFLLVGCGGDDGDDEIVTTTTAPSSTGTDQEGTGGSSEDIAGFCDLNPDLGDPMDPSYFGSPEHVDQIREMAEVAPDAIAEDVDLILDHFEQDAEATDSDAQDVDDLPRDVADAVRRVIGYGLVNCP